MYCLFRTHTLAHLLISAPSLGVFYFLSLTLSVYASVGLSVCLSVILQIDSSFFILDGIKPFFGHHLSMWHSTKRCSSIFDLGPLMLKMYFPKLLAITLHYHVATRGRALGTADLPGESRQSTELRADPCCHGNEIWVRRGGPVTYWLVNIY